MPLATIVVVPAPPKRVGVPAFTFAEEFVWDIGKKGSGWVLVIPTDFVFDFSAPRGLRWAVDTQDTGLLVAAAVHDWLLENGHDTSFASAEFRRVLQAYGKSSIVCWSLFFVTLVWTTYRRSLNNV